MSIRSQTLRQTSPSIATIGQNSFVVWRAPVVAILATIATAAPATVRLPALFGDNMVLQAGPRTPIYGQANPREVVAVRFGRHHARALADAQGRWRVEMNLPASRTPRTLEVEGAANRLAFRNVLVGEVWICSGQSNMEWSYHDAKAAGQRTQPCDFDRPRLRLFKVKKTVAIVPLDQVQGHWEVCDPTTANDFSQLAIQFANHLQDRLDDSVGLVESDWGGTPAEAWTPHEALASHPDLRWLIASTYPVPVGAGHETRKKHKPERAASVLYNAMIHPLMDFGFQGVLWYQGESNVGRADDYRRLFPVMISAWRREAGRPFPFVFVQLANYGLRPAFPMPSDWAELREAQMSALALPNTAMATAVDLGNPTEIHWMNRQTLGQRLAWTTLDQVYDRKAPATGPRYLRSRIEGKAIRVEFEGKLNGLVTKGYDGLAGFEIAGKDQVFHCAEARIQRGTVLVSCPEVPHPVAVRYAWANDPVTSLYNSAGLPALPFRTDDWPR